MRIRGTTLSWLVTLAVPFAFLLGMNAWFESTAPISSEWGMTKANVLVARVANNNELPTEGWQTVSLPHRAPSDGRYPATAWYEFNVTAHPDAKNEVWAVYIPRPSFSNFAIFVNGHPVGDAGPMESPIPLHTTPLLFEFAGALLHPGDNRIHVRMLRDLKTVLLHPLAIGPSAQLTPQYESTFFLQSTLKRITVVCMLVMSALMLTLFSMRTRDAAFAWFALALIFWATHILILITPSAPFNVPYLWIGFEEISLGAYVVCSAYFVHRFLDIDGRRIEKWSVIWFAFGAAVLVVDPLFFDYSWPWFFDQVWFRPLLVLGAYITWRLVQAYRRQPNPEHAALVAASWFELVIGVRDGMVQVGWMPAQAFLLPYTVGPVLIAFGFILLRRFMRAVADVERARDELEIRVREKTAELERNLVRIKDMERERALSAERERIMRDVHDGVGGQLVHALSIASRRPELGAIQESLENCLLELRLIIDSLEPAHSNLASVLGTLRTRMARRWSSAGLEVHWDVHDCAELVELHPNCVLHVLRIVQEAMTNTLKHAHATQIQVRVHQSAAASDYVAVEVADNGIGFSAARSGGHGLRNMEARAREINGTLTIDSSSSGTRVRLTLPIAAAAEMALPADRLNGIGATV